MSAFSGSASDSGNTSMRSSGRPAARPKMTGVVPGRIAAQAFEGAAKLPGPRLADRIVERDDETGAGRRLQPPLDQVPRLQIVRQRDGAEIMAERRADAGSDGEHGGDAGHDRRGRCRAIPPGRPRSPRRRPPPWRRRRDRRPRRRRPWRLRPPCSSAALARDKLLAIVGGDAGLVGAQVKPVEIGPVAEEEFAPRPPPRLASGVIWSALPGPSPMTKSLSAHGRPAQPATSTIEK